MSYEWSVTNLVWFQNPKQDKTMFKGGEKADQGVTGWRVVTTLKPFM